LAQILLLNLLKNKINLNNIKLRRKKMKKITLLITLLITVSFTGSVFAFYDESHKRVTSRALEYMGSSYASAEQKRAYDLLVNAAGSLKQAKQLLGQAAVDIDYFMDTRLGEWWIGYHNTAGDLTFGLMNNNYTSMWHFINMTRGTDAHGNDHGGYDYRYVTDDTANTIDRDWTVRSFLHNQQLHDDDFDTTEAHYRQGSSSDKDQYEDFQETPWQPVDNLGLYWLQQFAKYPTFQSLGYVTHAAGDVGVAQHVWISLGNYHVEYEEWIEDHFGNADQYNFGDFAAIKAEMANYNSQDDFRATLTKTAEAAYLNAAPNYDGSETARLNNGSKMVQKSIATIATVMTKAINILYGEDSI
jgi:hypothetical protein